MCVCQLPNKVHICVNSSGKELIKQNYMYKKGKPFLSSMIGTSNFLYSKNQIAFYYKLLLSFIYFFLSFFINCISSLECFRCHH